MPSLRPLLVVFVLVLSTALPSFSQVTSTADATQTPVAGAGHNYIRMLNESVNPELGTVSVSIGVPVPPGRKLSLPFSFQYSSGGALFLGADWQQGWGAMWTSTMAPLNSGGWSYALPSVGRVWKTFTIPPQPPSPDGSTTCSTTIGYVFTDANGTQHNLYMAHVFNDYQTSYGYPNYACRTSGFPNGETDTGGDSIVLSNISGATSCQQCTGPSDGGPTITDPDGTTYSFGAGPFPPQAQSTSATVPLSGISDRNGNSVGVSYTFFPEGNPQWGDVSGFTMTDSIGRPAVSAATFGQGNSTVNVSGLPQPYTAAWSMFNYSGYTVSTQNETSGGCAGSGGTFPGQGASESVITSLTLPNNQAYHFTYDPVYGTLDEIQYPSGGYVKYTWGFDLTCPKSLRTRSYDVHFATEPFFWLNNLCR